MTLSAFATVEDLAARRPQGVSDGDRPRAQAALDDASTWIRAEVSSAWTEGDDIPGMFLAVACAIAKRIIDNPDGIVSESLAQGYSATLANSSSDAYFTKAERQMVRKAAGIGEVFTLATTRDLDNIGTEIPSVRTDAMGDTIFLETDPPGDPLPWLTPE